MKKLFRKIISGTLASAAIFTYGCTTPIGLGYTAGDTVAPIAGIGGGTIGYLATSGKSQDTRMLAAGAGALGAYMLAEMLKNRADRNRQKEFRDGFYLGASNVVKMEYWEIQDLQKGDPNSYDIIKRKYTFPGVSELDGVNYMPHTVQTTIEEMR